MSDQEARVSLAKRISDREVSACVMGLGYVGLPLALTIWNAGLRILGFDIDPQKIMRLQCGESYIGHIDSSQITQAIESGRFEATDNPERLSEADVLIICVPTPLLPNRDPDLSFVEATCNLIAAQLRHGQLVILESTTYPGTTRQVVLPILERSGLTIGFDFFLAYSPEREDPGNPKFSTAIIPKVVGGIDEHSLRLANDFYSLFVVKTVPVSSCDVAEACKMLENTYRAVNIALVNELKLLLEKLDINIWEVIDTAKSKPFGFQAFYPGPGLGGHCIPIDPFYLSWLARRNNQETRFIELAGEINTSMPMHVVEVLAEKVDQWFGKLLCEAKIGILGVAYKKDVDDTRESPAFVIMNELLQRGASISYHDPHVPRLPKSRNHQLPTMDSTQLTATWLASLDAVVIVTDHSSVDYGLVVQASRMVLDTRNATRAFAQTACNVLRA